MESSMSCCQMLKFSMSKLVMGFVGTLFLTIFFSTGNSPVILLGLWILNIFFWKISGSHFNPAVTFAFMFRKDDKKMPWKIALAYMVAQTLGGFIGALLLNFYTFELPILTYADSFFLRALVQELLCTFIYVFFFMTCTDEKLLFSNEKAINCFILASAFVGARVMFAGQDMRTTENWGAVMNPGIAMGIQMSTLLSDGFEAWDALYLYPTVPFGAAFLSVLFYELVYKKTQQFLSHGDDASDNSGNNSDNMAGEHD